MPQPLDVLAASISAQGITAPSYPEIYESLQAEFQSIYGSDAYIAPDSQDGQLLAIVAKAIHDTNQTAITIYQSFSPATAFGAALSTNVKINGIARRAATSSQVTLLLIGQAGTVIENGQAADTRGNRWVLPPLVTINPGGEVEVLATARDPGAVEADAGAINKIVTHTRGWQSVTNELPALPGVAAELDGALRQRQAISTSNPAQTVIKSLRGAIAAIPTVIRSEIYENDTNQTDSRGIPGHSIAVVCEGGDAEAIAAAISVRKTPGAFTYGTTEVQRTGLAGMPERLRFFYATPLAVRVNVYVRPLPGFISPTMDAIKQAVADYINALGIGRRVDQGRLYLPAQLMGATAHETYEVNAIWLSVGETPPIDSDLTVAFNELATCDPDDVMIYVT